MRKVKRSTKTTCLTSLSGTTTLPPNGSVLMYVEKNQKISTSPNVVISFGQTGEVQISNSTFFTNALQFQLKILWYQRLDLKFNSKILHNGKQNIQSTKETNCSSTSTKWISLSSDFPEANYCITMIYDQMDTLCAQMSFRKVMTTHAV